MEIYKDHEEPVILIACGDGYAELLSKHRDELSKVFVVPYIDYDLLEVLISKEGFYKTAEKYGLPYPKTKIITMDDYKAENYLTIPFNYPVELKQKTQFHGLIVNSKAVRRPLLFTMKQN